MTNAFGNTVDSGAFAETFDRALAAADVEVSGAPQRQRGKRLVARARLCLSHQGDRRLAARECRYPLRGRRHRVVDHRHPDDRARPRDDLPADPRRPPRPAERAHPAGPGRHRPIPLGGGHGSSRATYMGGTAIWRASDEIIAKGTRIAADALEAAEADIRFEDGRFVVSGTDRSVALLDVAAIARDKGAPLDTYHAWTREWMTFPNGAHVVEVEIDPRDRRGDARPLHRGRRLRRPRQPDDRRRPGARRDRPRRRPGPARARASTTPLPVSSSPARSWITRCRAPTICPLSTSASTARAARPTRSASKAAARPAPSPPSRPSPTPSQTLSAPQTFPAPPPRSGFGARSEADRSLTAPAEGRPGTGPRPRLGAFLQFLTSSRAFRPWGENERDQAFFFDSM